MMTTSPTCMRGGAAGFRKEKRITFYFKVIMLSERAPFFQKFLYNFYYNYIKIKVSYVKNYYCE